MNSAGQTKLQLRLENDEPKCANCAKWNQDKSVRSLGVCRLVLCSKSIQQVIDSPDVASFSLALAIRTDLSVCSEWEPKE